MDWSFSLLNHPTFFEWLTRPSQQQIRTFPREPGWFYKTTGEPSIACKSLGQIFGPFSATTVMYVYIYIHTDVQHRYKHAVFGPIVLGPEHFGATGFARSPTFGPLSQGKREHRPLGTGMVTVRFFFFSVENRGISSTWGYDPTWSNQRLQESTSRFLTCSHLEFTVCFPRLDVVPDRTQSNLRWECSATPNPIHPT